MLEWLKNRVLKNSSYYFCGLASELEPNVNKWTGSWKMLLVFLYTDPFLLHWTIIIQMDRRKSSSYCTVDFSTESLMPTKTNVKKWLSTRNALCSKKLSSGPNFYKITKLISRKTFNVSNKNSFKKWIKLFKVVFWPAKLSTFEKNRQIFKRQIFLLIHYGTARSTRGIKFKVLPCP